MISNINEFNILKETKKQLESSKKEITFLKEEQKRIIQQNKEEKQKLERKIENLEAKKNINFQDLTTKTI